jgi:hypothetical protein
MSATLARKRNELRACSYLKDRLEDGMSDDTYTGDKSDIQGLGSVRRELSESTTLKMDSAGDQLFLRMSMQTFPFSEIFM